MSEDLDSPDLQIAIDEFRDSFRLVAGYDWNQIDIDEFSGMLSLHQKTF